MNSLLFQQLKIQLPDYKLHRISLNRHQEEKEWIEVHTHDYDQFLLYFVGHGFQTAGPSSYRVKPGSLFFLPQGIRHEFRRSGRRRPICLIFDLNSRVPLPFKMTALPKSTLAHIHQELRTISSSRKAGASTHQIKTASALLNILNHFLCATHYSPQASSINASPILKKLDRTLSAPLGFQLSVPEISAAMGYQKDYLNRAVKRETGLTLWQFRSQKILLQARSLLKPTSKIGDVSEALGFSDQNYFARWFHQQTGMSPRQWIAVDPEIRARS